MLFVDYGVPKVGSVRRNPTGVSSTKHKACNRNEKIANLFSVRSEMLGERGISINSRSEMAKREKKERSRGSAGQNRKSGEQFLDENRKKEGVSVADSGLQYSIVEEGSGDRPDEWSTVKIHQRCLLLDGKILEDTYRINEPDEVRIEELIEGLQEGLQMMTLGSRYKFWVPAELAWGRKGTGNKIPPNAVLAFDIRLVEIV